MVVEVIKDMDSFLLMISVTILAISDGVGVMKVGDINILGNVLGVCAGPSQFIYPCMFIYWPAPM